MVRYLDLLKVKTYEIKKEIESLNQKLNDKKLEITREYFEIGKRVIYRDYDGYIEGRIVAVNGFYISVDIDCVNGNKDKSICGIETFEADVLNLV